jgi:hypothetical protein
MISFGKPTTPNLRWSVATDYGDQFIGVSMWNAADLVNIGSLFTFCAKQIENGHIAEIAICPVTVFCV